MGGDVIIGGSRQQFYPSGTEVPGVKPEDNADGYYLLTTPEFKAMMSL